MPLFRPCRLGQHTTPALAASTTALAGGYFFFSILSGILFTAHWLSGKTLRAKILLTVLFFIPIWLAMAGIFYSLPYGVYNFIQYREGPLMSLSGRPDSAPGRRRRAAALAFLHTINIPRKAGGFSYAA